MSRIGQLCRNLAEARPPEMLCCRSAGGRRPGRACALRVGETLRQLGDWKMRAKSRLFVALAAFGLLVQLGAAHAATVVALGASNTAGKGVSSDQAFPAQLQAMLRAKGFDVTVINAGISGDTTGGMMARLDSAVPKGTRVVILQPGGNDMRKGAQNYAAELVSRLHAMGAKVVMVPNMMF